VLNVIKLYLGNSFNLPKQIRSSSVYFSIVFKNTLKFEERCLNRYTDQYPY
jgi:hypothetical protein